MNYKKDKEKGKNKKSERNKEDKRTKYSNGKNEINNKYI